MEDKITETELNEEWIYLNTKMRKLNKKRVEVYNKFKELKSDTIIELKTMRTISLYHDLYGTDLDK